MQRIEEGKGSWEGEWIDFLSTHPAVTSRAFSGVQGGEREGTVVSLLAGLGR